MQIKHITHPDTGRKIKVYAWPIIPREVLDKMASKEITTARELSWMLLNDKQARKKAEKSLDAGEMEGSFALNIVENALDWTLGLAVLNFIIQYVKCKKLPEPFTVAASRKGDVYIITDSGQVLKGGTL